MLPTLLRLAGPNVLVMLAQSSTGLIEAHFVGKLGTPALAGMALVFPGVMLMQMMSAGAMGGGMSSPIARALGGGRQADADALALHALAISAVLGLVFCAAGLLAGPALYRAMGGDGETLAAALQYSNVVFGGAVLLWAFNGLASCIRGTGDMLAPAVVITGGALVGTNLGTGQRTWALRLTGALTPVFLALGAGLLAMGVVNAAAVTGWAWFKGNAA